MGRFVFSGVVRPDNGLDNHVSKLPVQRALYGSGIAFTILQPVTLAQNLAASWDAVLSRGELGEPFPADVPIARVDYRDVAEVAATALTTDRLAGATLELAAESHDRRQLAALVAEVTGRPVRATTPSIEEWASGATAPADPQHRRALAAVYADYAANGSPGDPLALTAALGRPPRTMAAYVAELAAASHPPRPGRPARAAPRSRSGRAPGRGAGRW